MANNRNSTGVGGWLAFLIFWMVFLRPLAGAMLLIQMHAAGRNDATVIANSTWLVNTSAYWIVFLSVAALSIYGGLRLWRDHRPGSVQAAIAILWITTPIAAIALTISQSYLEGGVSLSDAVYKIGVNAAVAAAWTLYLRRSKRVKRTFYDQPAAGATGPQAASPGA